jgi:hypothetical protein
MTKLNNKWRKDYMKQGYIFMSRENIFKKCFKDFTGLKIGYFITKIKLRRTEFELQIKYL